MVARLSYGLGLFLGSLALGWALGRRGWLHEARAAGLLRLTVKWLSPVTLALSFWQMRPARGVIGLPVIGLLVALLSLLPAAAYAMRAGLTRPQIGAFLNCALFSNLGFFGAFVAFAMFGEPAYALAQAHLLFFSPCFYLLGFGLARRFGEAPEARGAAATGEELRAYPSMALLLGLSLSVIGLPRPDWCAGLNHLLIPVSTGLYLMAIGSQLVIEPWRGSLRPHLVMSLIKFAYCPAVALLLAWAFRLSGLAKFIVLLQASMPVAISPLMLPVLFGTDRKLTTSLWWWTTLLAMAWLPAYIWLIHITFASQNFG